MWWTFHPKYPERRSEDVGSREYDYVVTGGGTAGCVLASRLSENPDVSVLLIEKGPADDTWMSRIPIVSSNILKEDGVAKSWKCEPMTHCNNRQTLFFRGEVMGGGSRINAMVYTRGTKADYDTWALEHPEWSYKKVLPFFVKSEKTLNQPNSSYRGNSGLWLNRTFPYATWLYKVYQVFADCAVAMGFANIFDANDPNAPPDGLVSLDLTVNNENQRVSTFHAFLPRETALQRKNLTICTKTIVSHVVFSHDKKTPRVDKVKKEVILCSGAIGSPQVLMLSGIGPREHLKAVGVEVVYDLPGVGSNLADHHGIPVAWEVPVKESLAYIANSPIQGFFEFLKYVLFRSGILSMPIQPSSLFVRSSALSNRGSQIIENTALDASKSNSITSSPQDLIPDIEVMPVAYSAMDDLEEHTRIFSKIGIFSSLTTLVQPKSTGTVRLASSNPYDRPKVDFGILSNPEDYTVARTAIRLSLKIGADMKAAGFPLIRNLTFSEERQEKDIKNGNNEEIDKFIRQRIRSCYHWSSSCRMAPENNLKTPGVVDDELRVYGVSGLRVCDTSVFPRIPSGHLQAPAVMVAERCSDFILQGGLADIISES